jgi:hypothetical protein
MENLTSSPPRVKNEEFLEKVSPHASCFSPGVASFIIGGEPCLICCGGCRCAIALHRQERHKVILHSPFSEKATKGCYTFLHGEAILLTPLFPHSPRTHSPTSEKV